MSPEEKSKILKMRWRGIGYTAIAKDLGISEATIKTYCRRNNLLDVNLQVLLEARRDFAIPAVCKQCEKLLHQGLKRKPKQFCSDQCRLKWWNTHRHEINKKGASKLVCAACAQDFESYDADRKYCSHACYIKYRFGGRQNDSGSA